MKIHFHVIAFLAMGYIIAQIIRAIVIKWLTSTHPACSVGQGMGKGEKSPIESAGKFTFCLTVLILLFVFSDVLKLLIMTGAIGTVPIYGPKGEGLFTLLAQFKLLPASSGS